MRQSEFWDRVERALGSQADTVCRDRVLAELGQRTVVQALEDGEPPAQVWRALVDELPLPRRLR